MIWLNYRPALVIFTALVVSGWSSGMASAQTQGAAGGAEKKPPAQAMQHNRGPKRLALSNADGAVVTLWKPDLGKRELEPKMGMITLPPTGVDNYHAIVVERDWGDSVDAIVRYEYMRGKPSGESPRKLTSAVKTPVEVVPDPLPREHHRYYSRAEAAFILRYRDQVLANHPVVLQTSNGSSVNGVSDSEGRVVFQIPDDFSDVVPGERDQRGAELSVSTEYQAEGVQYNSVLTAEYRVSPEHWQSKPWGVAVAGIGFVFGGFLTRRIARHKKGGAK